MTSAGLGPMSLLAKRPKSSGRPPCGGEETGTHLYEIDAGFRWWSTWGASVNAAGNSRLTKQPGLSTDQEERLSVRGPWPWAAMVPWPN